MSCPLFAGRICTRCPEPSGCPVMANYVTSAPIPELGARVGDTITVEPGGTRYRVLVIRGFGGDAIPVISRHRDHLTLVSFHASLRPPARWLGAHAVRESRRPRLV